MNLPATQGSMETDPSSAKPPDEKAAENLVRCARLLTYRNWNNKRMLFLATNFVVTYYEAQKMH